MLNMTIENGYGASSSGIYMDATAVYGGYSSRIQTVDRLNFDDVS